MEERADEFGGAGEPARRGNCWFPVRKPEGLLLLGVRAQVALRSLRSSHFPEGHVVLGTEWILGIKFAFSRKESAESKPNSPREWVITLTLITSADPNGFPKAPSPHAITVGVRVSAQELGWGGVGEDTNVQPKTGLSS